MWLTHADQPAERGLGQAVLGPVAQDPNGDVVGEPGPLVLGLVGRVRHVPFVDLLGRDHF
jgi:hypothetical protein